MRAPRFRRRGDYWRPIVAALLTAVVTGVTQFAFQAASDAARSRYWHEYQRATSARIMELERAR